ncbi:DUF2254 domain-containing protein [Alteromonas aestuariivivens]|uniref:DUF2254 domain-containing protein n=1 Tax=Alteromonas aestuariivivens TaxID=1938339 RepID=A0A3D8M8I6_9ALTE|nr:DUF2254 domain-containing protein [Alteromonas aestuariivivens]RDV26109.1 DUF2254 domain-containing protein [Alteromonas aestuariivivens]
MLPNTLKTRLNAYMESISTSYWFIPTCMMALSILLCFLSLRYIHRANLPDGVQNLFPDITQEGAQQLLSTIATSMISATSIAFSMTIVALTLASSQFGSRLLRTFMLDKGTQVVLGTLVATFLFCLLALHHLSSIQSNLEALSLLAGISVLLGLIDVFVIIYFIHHLSRAIQADSVIHQCFHECLGNLDNLLPDPQIQTEHKTITEELPKIGRFRHTVRAMRSGFIQTITYSHLTKKHFNGVFGVEIKVRSGDHVLLSEPLFVIHSTHPISDDMLKPYRQCVLIGSKRTPVQDPEFAISQIVEIALRALSPGINDPHTAITCVNRLSAACGQMAERHFPTPCIIDLQSNVWLQRRTFTMASIINKAFDQIRQAGAGHLSVTLCLLENLTKLCSYVEPKYMELLEEQASATLELTLMGDLCRHDRQILRVAYDQFQNAREQYNLHDS